MKDKAKNKAPETLSASALAQQLKDLQNEVSDEAPKASGKDRDIKVGLLLEGSGRKGG